LLGDHTFIGARLISFSDASLSYLQSGTKLGEVYYLVTNPDLSGPIPSRPPPHKGSLDPATPLGLTYKKSFSLQSTPSKLVDNDDELDEDEDDDELPQKSKRALNDISNFVLDLPPFATGIFVRVPANLITRSLIELILSLNNMLSGCSSVQS